MAMLAEYGTMSLAQVLEPAIRLSDGYPIEAETANSIERNKQHLKQWKHSPAVLLPHLGEPREAPTQAKSFANPISRPR
jgi:gamma-glutamyltranspeptidase/glutathione hydrolase